jgi:hypothetical protein
MWRTRMSRTYLRMERRQQAVSLAIQDSSLTLPIQVAVYLAATTQQEVYLTLTSNSIQLASSAEAVSLDLPYQLPQAASSETLPVAVSLAIHQALSLTAQIPCSLPITQLRQTLSRMMRRDQTMMTMWAKAVTVLPVTCHLGIHLAIRSRK